MSKVRVYLDTDGFMALFSKEGWEIIEKEFGGESDVIFFVSLPSLLKNFSSIFFTRRGKKR